MGKETLELPTKTLESKRQGPQDPGTFRERPRGGLRAQFPPRLTLGKVRGSHHPGLGNKTLFPCVVAKGRSSSDEKWERGFLKLWGCKTPPPWASCLGTQRYPALSSCLSQGGSAPLHSGPYPRAVPPPGARGMGIGNKKWEGSQREGGRELLHPTPHRPPHSLGCEEFGCPSQS